MTTRRGFLGTLCAASAAAGTSSGSLSSELARLRQQGWQPFEWKADRPMPAATPHLLGDKTLWRLRGAAVPKSLWTPRTEAYEAPKPRADGNSGAPGYVLLDLTAAYLSTGKDMYGEQAVRTLLRSCGYKHWGGINETAKDTDLHAGALLMGGGVAYNVFRDRLSAADRQLVLDKLELQARLMYNYHRVRPEIPWEQNHTYIDLGGLWCTAVALHDEAPAARDWYTLGSRAIRNAVYLLDEPDGAFYEGISYWDFGVAQHLLPLLEMFRNVSGEDPFSKSQFLRNLKYYLMHVLLPGGSYWLNLGDAGATNLAEAHLERARYAMLKLAAEYRDPECQFLAGYFARLSDMEAAHDPWTLAFWDPAVGERDPRQSWQAARHFTDLGLITARDGWRDDATHFALRCGPPLGQRATKILLSGQVPKWKPGTGHVHPDLNGFLIFDHGEHLAVDTGYTWEKRTREHSTVAVDGGGQMGDGQRWPDYAPYSRYGRIAAFQNLPGECGYLRGDAAAGYQEQLNLSRFDRHVMTMWDADRTYFVVHDILAADDPHRFEWILIAADKAVQAAARTFRVRSGERALTLWLLQPADALFVEEPVNVSERPMPGSNDLRGYRLSFSQENRKSAEFLAVLSLHSAADGGPKVMAEKKAIRISAPGWKDIVAIGGSAAGIECDGHHAMLRQEQDAIVRWAAQDARKLQFESRLLLQASAPVSIAAGPRGAVVEARQAADLTVTTPAGKTMRTRVAAGSHDLRYT